MRNVLISFLVRSSDTGVSNNLKNFKRNSKDVIKLRKSTEKKILGLKKKVIIPESEEKLNNKSSEEKLLTREEARQFLKISFQLYVIGPRKGKLYLMELEREFIIMKVNY